MTWQLIGSLAAGLALTWILLAGALLVMRPGGGTLQEALRLLPDLLRLLRRLAGDPTMPRSIRVRLVLLFAYLAMPIDLIPDFIPVLGYADDAIIVAATLRAVVRRVGADPVRHHWPGTPAGLDAMFHLAGLGSHDQRPETGRLGDGPT